jgi:hypothetical protein
VASVVPACSTASVRPFALALLVSTLALTACTGPVAAPEQAEPREVYQRIADALPRATFGWGTPPGIIHYTASAKREGPPPEPEPLSCNESGFRVHLEVYRPRAAWIPYAAVDQVLLGWKPFPNVLLAPLLIVPLQAQRVTVVFDATKVSGLLEAIDRECQRLEAVSREVGMGGPWSFAQDVRQKVKDDAVEFGEGKLAVYFDAFVLCPAEVPYAGKARPIAEAFAWAHAHPTAPPR